MKRLLNIFFFLLLANAAMAQAPQGIPYQAVARNSSGALLASQAISVRFTIHDATAGGTVVYQETFGPTTTALGLFSVNVGTGTVVSGTFSSMNWGTNAKYMQVEMDPAGGSSYVDMGTQQMMSVPYAIYSNNGVPTGNAGDILYNSGSGWVQLPIGTTGQMLTVNGSGLPAWADTTLLTTTGITAITGNTATCGGSIISSSGTVTAYGVCWGTGLAPTVSGSFTTDGSGIANYTSSITGLTGSTTYYVRAYATTSTGTVYGNQVSFTTMPAIGAAYQGGVIGYYLQPGDMGYDPLVSHGLIASTSEQSTGVQWYDGTNTSTYATGTAIGTGLSNTMAIIATQGVGTYAATVARNYAGGGYTDWYLPSKDELNQLYNNKIAIGGFSTYLSWSSSEVSSGLAWLEYFSTGSQIHDGKLYLNCVRAIRAF